VVEYRRGVVDIHDLQGLERAACPCYRIVRDQYDLLLPPAFTAQETHKNGSGPFKTVSSGGDGA
jgi:hypothetical protein